MSLTNRERAEIAAECLDQLPDAANNSSRENVIDLLTDLRHFCDYDLQDFEDLVRISREHWEAERRETDE